jgi:nitrogen fixation protein FixH
MKAAAMWAKATDVALGVWDVEPEADRSTERAFRSGKRVILE